MSSSNSVLLSLTYMHRSYMEQMTKMRKLADWLTKCSLMLSR
jgi:hypothetical protein